jgi:hypothetical protein
LQMYLLKTQFQLVQNLIQMQIKFMYFKI